MISTLLRRLSTGISRGSTRPKRRTTSVAPALHGNSVSELSTWPDVRRGPTVRQMGARYPFDERTSDLGDVQGDGDPVRRGSAEIDGRSTSGSAKGSSDLEGTLPRLWSTAAHVTLSLREAGPTPYIRTG